MPINWPYIRYMGTLTLYANLRLRRLPLTKLMTLYSYFKQKETLLPNPNGSLLEIVPSTSISIVNRELKTLLEEAGTSGSKKRGTYQNFTREEKAKIAKRAAEIGVTNSIRHFQK